MELQISFSDQLRLFDLKVLVQEINKRNRVRGQKMHSLGGTDSRALY